MLNIPAQVFQFIHLFFINSFSIQLAGGVILGTSIYALIVSADFLRVFNGNGNRTYGDNMTTGANHLLLWTHRTSLFSMCVNEIFYL